MRRFSGNWMGRAAIWIATYAFVLNALLASILISSASAPAFAGPLALCGNAHDSSPLDQSDDSKAVGQAAAHCKLCCASVDGAALAPSVPMVCHDAVFASFRQHVTQTPPAGFSRLAQYDPRGPPVAV